MGPTDGPEPQSTRAAAPNSPRIIAYRCADCMRFCDQIVSSV